jgi:pimeloyl-ACP methyl ester carboxylesterase
MDLKWKETILSGGIHGFVAGSGTPVILLPGWPETAEAYSGVFPRLADCHQIFALDPPGLGESAPAPDGYDTANVAKILSAAVNTVTSERIHLVGHDVGGWIAYAWAAQFSEDIKSLTLLDTAVPGTGTPQTFPLPAELNAKLWQFSFNTLQDLPELLTAGRERELFDWLFKHKSERLERIPQANRDRYVETYARPGAMSRGFAYYRAVAESARQNKELSKTKLSMPVLALGGGSATGGRLKTSMESLALHVEGGVIEDCGHYVMEEQPESVSERLIAFFEHVEASR